MKSKEEIDELYHKYWDDFSNKYDDNLHYYSFVEGYTKCQEDMADKKYTEEDMLKCWNTYGYNNGYNQCKKDMANKKYTEEDMIKFAFDTYCYISGIMKVPFNQVSENRTHAEENLKVFINSLNKQD